VIRGYRLVALRGPTAKYEPDPADSGKFFATKARLSADVFPVASWRAPFGRRVTISSRDAPCANSLLRRGYKWGGE
jgi:hypothetical protein